MYPFLFFVLSLYVYMQPCGGLIVSLLSECDQFLPFVLVVLVSVVRILPFIDV